MGFTEAGFSPRPIKLRLLMTFLTLFGLRSFFFRSSCFIAGFAHIARPLTEILKGENGKVSANYSRKVIIELSPEQSEVFDRPPKM